MHVVKVAGERFATNAGQAFASKRNQTQQYSRKTKRKTKIAYSIVPEFSLYAFKQRHNATASV